MSDRVQGKLGSTPGARQVLRQLAVCVGVAAVLATVFTAWTPASLRPGELVEQLAAAADRAGSGSQSTAVGGSAEVDQHLKVGIVAGHSGPNRGTGLPDPGSVCADGLTELQVNSSIADLVVSGLQAAGIEADLLQEFDPRLTGYRAIALVSIHADACVPINDQATGFKVAAALDTSVPDRAQRLVACLADRFAQATDLPFRPGSITRDMTEYHSFYEIHSQTPAAIIETGFLYLDRDFLTSHPDRAARGIAEGILCYINNEPATLPGEAEGP
ncbi:MAG TPA: N-acetylmuramoyl-L-alanine amidase [Anaerolineales bacterium]|jgi:N-acetylmuramoyl-L-alanine amidase|nr:N-acetylmuramoyl-L-alanine amidase [Anaerolineales bacterium]